MAENNGSREKPGLFAGLTLSTFIQICTLAAAIVAQWALMDSQIDTLRESNSRLALRVDTLTVSINGLSERTRVLEVQYDNLRDVVLELRRQSGLQPTEPLPVP